MLDSAKLATGHGSVQAEGVIAPKQAFVLEKPDLLIDAQPGHGLVVPEGFSITEADYVRMGPDLVLVAPDGTTLLVRGYFTIEEAPDLVGADGALIPGDLALKLAGPLSPGDLAQAGAKMAQQAIGRADTMNGNVTVVHADGTKGILHKGDPIFQGDILQTDKGASIGMLFMDGTTMALGGNGRLVLDEMVYDAATHTGKSAFSLVQGSFSFVSGQIAKSAPDAASIRTPVATIGIRGTLGAGGYVPGSGLTVSLLPEGSGGGDVVGELVLYNQGGTQTINGPNMGTQIQTQFSAPPPPILLNVGQITANFGQVLQNLASIQGTQSATSVVQIIIQQGTALNVQPGDMNGQGGQQVPQNVIIAIQPVVNDPKQEALNKAAQEVIDKLIKSDTTIEKALEVGIKEIIKAEEKLSKGGKLEEIIKDLKEVKIEKVEHTQEHKVAQSETPVTMPPATVAATVAPTVAATAAPTVEATVAPTVEATVAPTSPPQTPAPTSAPTNQSYAGTVVDGYIAGATVYLDVNGNETYDEGIDPSTTTASDGSYTFSTTETSGTVYVTGGKDMSTNLNLTGTLKAPLGSDVVTPLTTLVAAMMESGGLTKEQAATQVAAMLGVPAGTDLLNTDPVAGAAANPELLKASMMVQSMVVMAANLLQGAGAPSAGAAAETVFATLATQLKNAYDSAPGTPVDFTTNTTAITALVEGAAAALPTPIPTNTGNLAGALAGAATAMVEFNALIDAASGANLLEDVSNAARTAQEQGAAALKSSGGTGTPPSITPSDLVGNTFMMHAGAVDAISTSGTGETIALVGAAEAGDSVTDTLGGDAILKLDNAVNTLTVSNLYSVHLNPDSAGKAQNLSLSNVGSVMGTTGDDVLLIDGTTAQLAGLDVYLEGGNDSLTLTHVGGAMYLSGGGGLSDTLVFDTGANMAISLGDETISDGGNAATMSGFENVTTGSGNDILTGTGGVNTLIAGGGDDLVDGSGGADWLDGGAGDHDTVSFADADAIMDIDLAAGAASYVNTTITLAGFENVIGSAAGDTITGNALGNSLFGGGGCDVLSSGAGDDILTGGENSDSFWFTASTDSGSKIITDFQLGEVIHFTDFDIATIAEGDNYDVPANGVNVHYNLADNATTLYFNSQADLGSADYTITLQGVHLTANDLTTMNGDLVYDRAPVVTAEVPEMAALTFDNVSDHIVLSNAPLLSGSNNFTIGMWIKPTGDGGTLYRQDAHAGQLGINTTLNADGSVYLGIDLQSSSWQDLTTAAGTVAMDEWSHLAFVKNGSSFSLYVNGEAVAGSTITLDGAHLGAAVSTKNAYFGFEPWDYSYGSYTGIPYDGLLGDLTVSTIALDQTGVANLMTSEPNFQQVGLQINGQITATDATPGDTLTYSVLTDTAHGSLNLNSSTGAYTYTPSYPWSADSFEVKVTDSYGVYRTISVAIPGLGSVVDDNITGTSGNDLVNGGLGIDQIYGEGGDDTLAGGEGEAHIEGGSGNDTYVLNALAGQGHTIYINDASGEADTLNFALGDTYSVEHAITNIARDGDTLVFNLRQNYTGGAYEAGQIKILNQYSGSGQAVEYITDGSGESIYLATETTTGLDGLVSLVGTEGQDMLVGRISPQGDLAEEVLYGGGGEDMFFAETGQTLAGGDGSDTAAFWNFGDGITVALDASGNADFVWQDGANGGTFYLQSIENIEGSFYGDNVLTGNDFNNRFSGHGFNNTIDGGEGTDTVSYASHYVQDNQSGISVDLGVTDGNGFASLTHNGHTDKLKNIENIDGSDYNDIITGDNVTTGNGNRISGGKGNDVLDGGDGVNDTVEYYDDVSGVTVNLGGAYADIVTVGANTAIDGWGNTDSVFGFEAVAGSDYDDILVGNDDVATRFMPGQGDDLVIGRYSSGDKVEYYDSTDSSKDNYGLGGITVYLNSSGYASEDAAGDDTLIADPWGGNDRLFGIEDITGSSYDDYLDAATRDAAGNNQLEGRGGNDILIGVGGKDSAAYHSAEEGIVVNFSGSEYNDYLADGEVYDGLGGVDTLTGISDIRGSDYDDVFLKGSAAATFYGNDGNDRFDVLDTSYAWLTNANFYGGDNDSGGDVLRLDDGTGPVVVDFTDLTGTINGIEYIDLHKNVDYNLSLDADMLTNNDYTGDGVVDRMIQVSSSIGLSTYSNVTIDASTFANTDSLVVNASEFRGDDSFTGGAGNDSFILDSNTHSDSIAGGGGTDSLSFASLTNGVSVDLANGYADENNGGDYTQRAHFTGIEIVTGGTGDDTFSNMANNGIVLAGTNGGGASIADDGVNLVSANLNQAMTVEVWVKFTSVAGLQSVFYRDSNWDDVNFLQTDYNWRYSLHLDGGHLKTGTYDGTGASATNQITSTTAIQANQWYHVAYTFSNNGYEKLYVDGVLEGSRTIGDAATQGASTDRFVVAGSANYNLGANSGLVGDVANFTVWDSVRSASQIADDMSESQTSGAPGSAKGFWDFGGLAAGSVADSSGNNASSATVHNATLAANSTGYTLYGGAGCDTLMGSDGVDMLYGGDNDDLIISGKGADVINGGDGIDTVDYSASDTVTVGGWTVGGAIWLGQVTRTDGGDTSSNAINYVEKVIGSATGTNKIDFSSASTATGVTINLAAGTVANATSSATFENSFTVAIGSDNSDTLIGSSAADTLQGLSGNDKLTGGTGADVFSFDSEVDTGTKTITDFSVGDKIDISNYGDFNAVDFRDIDTAGGDVPAGGIDLYYAGGNTTLYFNTSGSAAPAEYSITLEGVHLYAASLGVSGGDLVYLPNVAPDFATSDAQTDKGDQGYIGPRAQQTAVRELIDKGINDFAYVDSDGEVMGVAVVGTTGTTGSQLGTWQYTLQEYPDSESDWVDFPANVSATNALLLPTAGNVRFVPAAYTNTTENVTLVIRAWDDSNASLSAGNTADLTQLGTGGSSPFSAATMTYTISMEAVSEYFPSGGGTSELTLDSASWIISPELEALDFIPSTLPGSLPMTIGHDQIVTVSSGNTIELGHNFHLVNATGGFNGTQLTIDGGSLTFATGDASYDDLNGGSLVDEGTTLTLSGGGTLATPDYDGTLNVKGVAKMYSGSLAGGGTLNVAEGGQLNFLGGELNAYMNISAQTGSDINVYASGTGSAGTVLTLDWGSPPAWMALEAGSTLNLVGNGGGAGYYGATIAGVSGNYINGDAGASTTINASGGGVFTFDGITLGRDYEVITSMTGAMNISGGTTVALDNSGLYSDTGYEVNITGTGSKFSVTDSTLLAADAAGFSIDIGTGATLELGTGSVLDVSLLGDADGRFMIGQGFAHLTTGDTYTLVSGAGTLSGTFDAIDGRDIGYDNTDHCYKVLGYSQSGATIALTVTALDAANLGIGNNDANPITASAVSANSDVKRYIYALGGADTITVNATDVVAFGGGGADTFVVESGKLATATLDGGTGTDTLCLGTGTFDFTGLKGWQLDSIEYLEVNTGSTAILNSHMIGAFNSGALTITGNHGTIEMSGASFTLDGATLSLQDGEIETTQNFALTNAARLNMNGGSLAAGVAGVNPITKLDLDDHSFSMDSDSTLHFTLGVKDTNDSVDLTDLVTGYDRIYADNMALDGKLDLGLSNFVFDSGSTIADGTTFTDVLFSENALTGHFDSITGREIGQLRDDSFVFQDEYYVFDVIQNANDVDVKIRQVNSSYDVNGAHLGPDFRDTIGEDNMITSPNYTLTDDSVVVAAGGDDWVDVTHDRMLIFGGTGDDTFSVDTAAHLASTHVFEGGSGNDAIVFGLGCFTGNTLDLTSLTNGSAFENIEALYFGADIADKTMKLNADFLKSLESSKTDASGHTLVTVGIGTGDTVSFSDSSDWDNGVVNGGYTVYTHTDSATNAVDLVVNVALASR